jgi:hypothetical protein
MLPGLRFQSQQQLPGQALAAGPGVHHHLGYFGPVQAVGFRGQIELHAAQHLAGGGRGAGHQQQAVAGLYVVGHAQPVGGDFFGRQGGEKTQGGPGPHGVLQQAGESRQQRGDVCSRGHNDGYAHGNTPD